MDERNVPQLPVAKKGKRPVCPRLIPGLSRRWQPNGYHYIRPPKMRSICRRWFKSCAASKRTNSSTVCHPRTSCTP